MAAQRRPSFLSQFPTTVDLISPLFLVRFLSRFPTVIDLSAAGDDSPSWDQLLHPSHLSRNTAVAASASHTIFILPINHLLSSKPQVADSFNLPPFFSSLSEFGAAMLFKSEVPLVASSSPVHFSIKRKRIMEYVVVSLVSSFNKIVMEFNEKNLSPYYFCFKNFDPCICVSSFACFDDLESFGCFRKKQKIDSSFLIDHSLVPYNSKNKRKRCFNLPNKGLDPFLLRLFGLSAK